MFALKLNWKDFSVNLNSVDVWARENLENFSAIQAASTLELWFSQEPTQEQKDLAQLFWDSIESDSPEAESYKSKDDLKVESDEKRASGKSKLLALGLTEEEVSALLGV